MTLHDALGGMRDVAQWFLWRLEWDATQGKYLKTPCAMDGSVYRIDASKGVPYIDANGRPQPASWQTYDDVVERCEQLSAGCPADRTLQYALGFWLTADCGYWFFDLDHCVEDGALTPFAAQMMAAFPGALVEWSSSGKGLHIIGRAIGGVDKHRSRDIHKLNLEFYTQDRGIAFGLNGEAQGSADSDHTYQIAQLVATYFPPRAEGEHAGDGPRPDWRGPADDDALIARALAARGSAAVQFGGKASFASLWNGAVERNSDHDMALASHLAFWTGCDEERVVRLMMRSGLVREKWHDRRPHGTYLTHTVHEACSTTTTVYQEPERNLSAAVELYGGANIPINVQLAGQSQVITAETKAMVAELMDAISGAGSVEDMHNDVVPRIQSASVPGVYQEQLVRAVNAQLDLWQAKLPVGKLRALLFPPNVLNGHAIEAPDWMQKHCYVKDGDFFYDMSNGARLTYQGFIAEYARFMPGKPSGGRENPVDWAFTRWGITTVHHLGYRPDMPPYFTWDGLDYANLYSPGSVPAVAAQYTDAGVAGIQAFQSMLWDMCGRREYVYFNLLWWLAHNVQKPGVKIRWSPILKGTPGDAKTILSNVLRAAMGYRNVSVTGNSTLRASGGFNDWAVGAAVNVIEEIHLVGKDRHLLYNATKEFITNDVVNINAKGGKTYKTWNITNHLANSNHNDALPLDEQDRRWFVIFTPWESLAAMRTYCDLSDDAWKARTKAVDTAWRSCGSELRAWFLSLPIGPGFDPDGSAPETPERLQMIASSKEDAESVAQSLIEEGGSIGITRNVISSSCLTNALKVRASSEGYEVPRSTALNHMLTRLGFSKLPKMVKWRAYPHTIWIRNGFNGDIRYELETSYLPLTQPLTPPTR
jgi:hypothetical protein